MKTSPVTAVDLQRSVIAVPPLARHADLSLNPQANQALLRHLESGGVRSVMYGGNANFYNIAVSEYASVIDALADSAGADTWVLPSAGPDYGKFIDQARILRARAFPTAMLLPMSFPYTDAGLAEGVRRFSDALGRPAVVYIKSANYMAPATLARLIEEGRIAAVKYAVVREDPAQDAYLASLLAEVDARYVVSGIGERPAIAHFRQFGLKSFTSGSVCVAPRGSMQLLRSLHAGRFDEAERLREAYLPLEDCRDGISPIRVLHDAVTLAGVADMGPMLPLLSGLDAAERERVAPVARALLAQDGKAVAA
ncbi:dihydrodipicolinate synthase family protein [Bordetella pseudohinzii]|uniref:5-dehydro-4-deoxyglucarate dehydratase n=1 Tax=Bordetella pseudohinzii TaxID=1331258 RepID=A0A0J6EXE7_9BORD|nr:dihydrodipicolinate synthase family protein [Bordetella pseudohinzii]ANY15806.1 dihydrodipicolinate synthase family protein [Bordetella pseudohinzii]KMM25035.1 dihydrodipicolinate synthase [Bordetella pseudohinzii]KXA80374.1 dihydrodipicolinate synthase family protein [Bordetella pseudohinzii]KXA81373.1 dihydrodipicolinate synthase family protein [Bordetella pseudohinzii]CUI42983.1 5-dehydro-4-deoxyglucarate dehydratase [Bordetella pseudohinzii]